MALATIDLRLSVLDAGKDNVLALETVYLCDGTRAP